MNVHAHVDKRENIGYKTTPSSAEMKFNLPDHAKKKKLTASDFMSVPHSGNGRRVTSQWNHFETMRVEWCAALLYDNTQGVSRHTSRH